MIRRAGALVMLIALVTPAFERRALAGQRPGTFERYSYENDAGSFDYMLYVPPGTRAGRSLVVYIPGSEQTAEQAAYDTRFNDLARRAGFFVLYPEANLTDDGYFHYMEPEHQHRGRGEPSVIAGMTTRVSREWRIDRRRVYVGGMSNGAAMANVMVTTYPDLYVGPFAHAGCAYRGQCGAVIGSTVPAEASAEAIVAEMRGRARVVPFIVFQGTDDPAVEPSLSERTVRSWLLADDVFDDGRRNGSISTKPSSVRRGAVRNGHTFTVSSYRDATGCLIGEYWLVDDMRHAYSGGAPNTTPGVAVDPASERKVSFAGTDPLGPPATPAAHRFFARSALANEAC